MQGSTQTSDRLSSLPNELSSKVLGSLDDLDLYHFILTCRTLHHCALDILFQRHCQLNGPFDGTVLWINTGSKPSFLLSALHGALFITKMEVINIQFGSSTLSRLFDEIRLITALVDRLLGPLSALSIDFTVIACSKLYPVPESQFVDAVQCLVETALKKGSLNLGITEHSESWNLSSFGASKKEGLGRSVSRIFEVSPFTSFFTATKSAKSDNNKVEETNLWTKDGKADPDSNNRAERKSHENSGTWYKLIGSKSTPHKASNLGPDSHLCISTEMLFRPLWRKWTLNLLNSQLSTLTISTNCTSQEVWHNTLPNIYLPALKYFGITDQNVSLNDLGIFLQRHSSTLSWINLLIQDSSQLVDSDGQTSHNRIFAKRRVAFNFPNAEQLTLAPLCVQWLFRGVISFSAPTGKNGFKQSEPLTPHNYLPKLKSLTITLPYLRADEWAPDFFSQLDKALPTLAEFAKLGPPRDRDPSPSPVSRMNDQGRVEDWFSSLTINAMVVEPDLEQPNIDWFNLHASKGPASPLLALHTVSNLHLNYIITKPEGFHALPKFLALFKGLKRVNLLLQSTKVLKKMDTDFWKGFKQDCPGLETLQFQIAATILQVTMEDLVNGTAAL